MIWELREAGIYAVRTKSSEILAVKIKEVSLYANLCFIKVRAWPKRADFPEVAETTLSLS